MIQANSDKYQGAFAKGKKCGKGKLFFVNPEEVHKTQYEGEFREDQPNGEGVLLFENGSVYRGQFKDGKM